jgi:hypothetical protein
MLGLFEEQGDVAEDLVRSLKVGALRIPERWRLNVVPIVIQKCLEVGSVGRAERSQGVQYALDLHATEDLALFKPRNPALVELGLLGDDTLR